MPRSRSQRLLGTWTGAALALLAAAAPRADAQPGLAVEPRDPARPVRAAVFRAPGFPTVDAPAIPDAVLAAALAGLPVDTLGSTAALDASLDPGGYDVLVLPYGSAFPLASWNRIRDFVAAGGGLVVLGGAPFHQPVREEGGRWVLGARQPTFAREFQIGPAEAWSRDRDGAAIAGDAGEASLTSAPVTDSEWTLGLPDAATVYELTVRLATRKDLPDEHGSEGHRDAVLRPLVHVTDGAGLARACPLLEIDRLRGEGAGGRWLLAPSDTALPAEAIRAIVERALEGAAQLDARPVWASVEPGEVPAVRIVQNRPWVRAGEAVPERAEVVVSDETGAEVFRTEVALTGQPQQRHGVAEIRTGTPLAPGLYRVDVTTPDAPWHPRSASTGFWVRDEQLLASAPPVTVSRDWLRRGGEVFPVIGTTYMASDVQRKFLFEPDPLVWDRDFAQMAALGINFVRTGLWTGWTRAMLDPGAIDEGFLRALDAYVQTAARHGIVVNYTFFGFLPPAFGGTNPYLDPRAYDGQRAWLTMVARRYRGVHWIHWDLINEPSYAPPEGLWSNRPIYDRHERRAWEAWVRARHGTDEALLRDRWRDPTGDLWGLPRGDELAYTAIREHRRPRKAGDFVRFTNDVVAAWAATLRQILRDAGGDVLVTLGQDEGGTGTRPAQQLHAEAVDYTGIHPWWRNDDLLADGVLTKVPEKPNLYQETGLMRLEDLDGEPWRSFEVAAQTLERKYAYAFASRGAGSIEWAWNINPYQPIDNESVIGFLRPDGTAKTELRVIPDFARFFAAAAPWLDDFEPDEVVAVIPHSRLFMGRAGGVEGFKRLVRIMAERWGVVPIGLSELRLTPERLANAKLVILPSPLVLEGSAAEALAAAARAGTKVLVTGVVTGDPYGATTPALVELGIADPGRPVELRERTGGAGGGAWATFDQDARELLRRSEAPALDRLDAGGGTGPGGNVWHEPLPLEFAREEEPLAALLGAALEAAGVEIYPSEERVAGRLLYAPRAVLAMVVNEGAEDARRRLTVDGRAVEIPVPAGRSRLVLFERGTGRVIAATAGEAPTVAAAP